MAILVTGARGSIGKEVLAGLLAADQAVRATSRDPKPDDFPDGVEVVQADLQKPESFPALLAGVQKVFLYANAHAPEKFAHAAREAGVEHVVLLSSNSVLFPQSENNPVAAMHAKVERALEDSGLGLDLCTAWLSCNQHSALANHPLGTRSTHGLSRGQLVPRA